MRKPRKNRAAVQYYLETIGVKRIIKILATRNSQLATRLLQLASGNSQLYMKSPGFLSTLGVGLCVVAFSAFFLAPMYHPIFSNRLTFLWSCLMASDILSFNWLFLPEEWRASETVKTFFDSFNTSFLPINRWSILLIVTIESLWIYSLGSLIFRILKNPLEEFPLLRFCLTCLTGAAALSALTGFLGLIGCLQSWLFWTLAIIQLAPGVFMLIRNWSKLPCWRVPTTAYCLLP